MIRPDLRNSVRRDMADWRDMNSIFMDPPKLLCSLLAEHQINNQTDNLSTSNEKQSDLFPSLKDEAGYFVLGDESKAEEMFYFNIIIGQDFSNITSFEKLALFNALGCPE